MTRSYGGGPPERQKKKQPDLRADSDNNQSEQSPQRRLDSPSRYSQTGDGESLIEPVRIDFGKRMVAGIIDLLCAWGCGVIVGIIPFVNQVLAAELTMVVFLLIRDWLYGGRAVGKNLMGLQVVDVESGYPCSLMQSVKRNIVMFGPPLVLYIIITVLNILRIFKLPGLQAVSTVMSVLQQLGFIYLIIVIPYEAYRAYNRPDGRRFGDQFAGTSIVEAPMDFSSPFPARE
jgi:uncharacterized RDD family membrane protein YckC